MTLRQFLAHLYVWLLDFPPRHTWVRLVGGNDPPYCIVCGAVDKDSPVNPGCFVVLQY